MKAIPYLLILVGVLLVLFGVVALGDGGTKVAFIGIGVVAIFGAGLLQVLERRSR